MSFLVYLVHSQGSQYQNLVPVRVARPGPIDYETHAENQPQSKADTAPNDEDSVIKVYALFN
jgi:hypothetical protein